MALNDNAILTLAEAKAYLKISSSDNDTLLEEFINSASDEIERYCNGHKFTLQSITGEIHSGDGGNALYTDYFPIYSIGTGESAATSDVQYRVMPGESWTDLESNTDYILISEDKQAILLYANNFYTGVQNIKINYKVGYASGSLPLDVKMVCYEMVAMTFNKSKAGNDWLGRGSKTDNMGGASFSWSLRDLRPEWQIILDRYRRVNI